MNDFELRFETAVAAVTGVMTNAKAAYATGWPYWAPVVALAGLVGGWL